MYIVMKDGMYMMNYRDLGIREIDQTGEYRPIMTGLYSVRSEDAMRVKSGAVADTLGAVSIMERVRDRRCNRK